LNRFETFTTLILMTPPYSLATVGGLAP
jgi:hypothetical protein